MTTISSTEHGDVYKSIVKEYLKGKGISDFSNFQVALSRDKPIFLKWDYPNIERPTDQYLASNFKIDSEAPRKNLKLELGYIYIHATEVAHKLLREKLIPTLDDPIYFNIKGEIIFPSSLDMTD